MTEFVSNIRSTRWQHLLFILMIAALVAGSEGCKTTGKMSKKERKAQIETAKKQLHEIINGTSTKSLAEQDQLVTEIANKNYNDPDLNHLIIQAQEKLKKAFANQDKMKQQKVDAARAELLDMLVNKDNKTADELETELNKIKAQQLGDSEIDELIGKVEKKIGSMRSGGEANVPMKTKLERSFQSIADAGKSGNVTQASTLIRDILALFASDDAPVLIIISRDQGLVDYDKPTTIKRYLEFLKDQKASKNAVDSYQVDNDNKIKELELIKK